MAVIEDDADLAGADEPGDGDGLPRMTLIEHLAELRRRVMICLAAIAVGAVVGFLFYNRILDFLIQPYADAVRHHPANAIPNLTGNPVLVTGSPVEGIATRLKVSGYVGLLIALPVVLWQLWRFITPGLHKNEKRYAIPFLLSSLLLFGLGAVVAVLTFPKALEFLITISGKNVAPLYSPDKFISFYALVIAAFGITFEFPIVLVFLEVANVVTPRQLLGWWRAAIVIIFVAAAVITPSQDPYSLFAMALPMCLFYFVAIGIGKLLKK